MSCELPFALNNLPYLPYLLLPRLSLDTALAEDGDPLGLWQMSEKACHGVAWYGKAAAPLFLSPRRHVVFDSRFALPQVPKEWVDFSHGGKPARERPRLVMPQT